MLKKKINSKKGFTLAELLIVVAIIGILVAISVPIFTSQLEEARSATDQANVRAAKAAAVTKLLDDTTTSGTFYYDAKNGQLLSSYSTIDVYGKSKTGKGKILKVDITVGSDNVTPEWVSKS